MLAFRKSFRMYEMNDPLDPILREVNTFLANVTILYPL